MREIDRVLARLPFVPVVAALFAIVAIVLVVATPQWLFERWVGLSGIATVIPAATPPLGATARFAAAIAAGLVAGAGVWLLLVIGEKLLQRSPRYQDVEEAVPETAPRPRPLFAGNELGAPLMSDEAMAQARDELILEIPLDEAAADRAIPLVAADTAPPEIKVEEPKPQPLTDRETPQPDRDVDEILPAKPVRVQPIEGETIPTLLDRLDAALARKPLGYRPVKADVTRLRRALGR